MAALSQIDRERGSAMNPLHQLQHSDPFCDDRQGRSDPSFDDAIDLVIEMDQIIPSRDQEQPSRLA